MTSTADTSAIIASVVPFDSCSPDELAQVTRLAKVVQLPAGTTLMTQGDPGTEMVILGKGRASIARNGLVIAERGPGEVIGEMALLSDQPRTATVTLLEDSRLVRIERDGFRQLMDGMPAFRERIKASLALRAREL